MRRGSTTSFVTWLGGAALIAALAAVLYVPFLSNPLVFDDRFFFRGTGFSYYATHPLGLGLRLPPYFSLAAAQVLWGKIEAQRLVSLALHIACALALYKLLYDLLEASRFPVAGGSESETRGSTHAWAIAGAAAFAVHPVAVYGSAYLVERSIVLATLFSLLSVVLFLRGLRGRSYSDALVAAFLYSLAVLSKEHAILLPAAAVLTVRLANSEQRFAFRYVVRYLALCAPAAIVVFLLSRGVIGQAYEPDFHALARQTELVFGKDIAEFSWPLSVVTQAGLFFRYLALWLWPRTREMSVDLRVDFLENWSATAIVLRLAAFALFGILGFVALWRSRRLALVGFGMLFFWIPFFVEFSAVRFQEPFVLYRSYLWGPGALIAAVGALRFLPAAAAWAVLAAVCPVFISQAHDRLETFASPLALWQDAVAKLPAKPVPWGSRTLYNLGREYLYGGQPERAIAIADRCIAQYPDTAQCYYARGAIELQLEHGAAALPYLKYAEKLAPRSGIIAHRIGLALEYTGRIDEAKAYYRRALALGYWGAGQELLRLEHPGSGVLPPGARRTIAR